MLGVQVELMREGNGAERFQFGEIADPTRFQWADSWHENTVSSPLRLVPTFPYNSSTVDVGMISPDVAAPSFLNDVERATRATQHALPVSNDAPAPHVFDGEMELTELVSGRARWDLVSVICCVAIVGTIILMWFAAAR